MKNHPLRRTLAAPRVLTVLAMLAAGHAAGAGNPDNPDPSDDVKFSWTNTFKYGAAWRLKQQSPVLLASPNADDGDRNFNKGLISNRAEWLTELDAAARGGFGARISAAAWYDTVYNAGNDNPGFAGGAAPNQASVPYNAFVKRTRDLQGRSAELRDAFVFASADVGGAPLTARLGQHALVWGESLFFANNAIAGAQNAFDVNRLLADPTAQAKEFVLPVPQLSGQLQLSSALTLGAYYQFRYRANRLPAVGSYFSVNDTNVDGAERLLLGPAASAARGPDLMPRNGGQYGVQLRWQVAETDLGFYALRFHDKDFQQVVRLAATPAGVVPASYYLAYNQDSSAFGASASRSFGSVNVALEASLRRNQALASSHAADASALAPPGAVAASDNTGHPAYATGNTAHVNASLIWSLEPSALWREASLVGEIAWNRLLSCRVNCAGGALDPNATRDAAALRVVFEPTYRQVTPGLDLGFPLGAGYSPRGSRSALGPSFPAENGGDVTLGVNGVYEQVWRVSLAYTHFAGAAGTLLDATQSFSYRQARKDRDFASFSVRRSF